MNKEKCDHTVKIIVIGDSGVGKTNVISRFKGDVFKKRYIATIGIDFQVSTMEIDGKKIKV